MNKTLRVLSCVPKQRYTDHAKFQWVREMAREHKPDLFVLPQEYHGGIQTIFFADKPGAENMKVAYEPQLIIDCYFEIAREFDMGIAVGALVDDPILGERRERIFIIDPKLGCTGFADKMVLPAYDHIDAKGRTRVFPEVDMNKRAQAFECKGARVGILFCWEVYSSYLWHAISRAQPDFVVSMVKFGVKGWPQKAKNESKESIVTGFGFGSDGGWLERLQMAAKWDIAAPIICSTNSWDLPKKCGAIAGQILPWDEKETTGEYARHERKASLWVSSGKGNLTEDHVQVDEVDFMYWRYIRDHKFTLNEATGEWPSAEARNLTMAWKVKRMERAFVGLPKLMAGKPNVKAKPDLQPRLFDE